MFKTILFYISMVPLTVLILTGIALIAMLAATGVAGIILGVAYAMIPAPTGL